MISSPFRRFLQEFFKISSRRLQDVSRCLQDFFKMSQDVFKMSQDVFKMSQDVFKISSRCLKMFSRCLKTSSRFLQDVSRCFQDVSRRLQDVFKMSSRRLQDVTKTSWTKWRSSIFWYSSEAILGSRSCFKSLWSVENGLAVALLAKIFIRGVPTSKNIRSVSYTHLTLPTNREV